MRGHLCGCTGPQLHQNLELASFVLPVSSNGLNWRMVDLQLSVVGHGQAKRMAGNQDEIYPLKAFLECEE